MQGAEGGIGEGEDRGRGPNMSRRMEIWKKEIKFAIAEGTKSDTR